jgi:hypothetical protein
MKKKIKTKMQKTTRSGKYLYYTNELIEDVLVANVSMKKIWELEKKKVSKTGE